MTCVLGLFASPSGPFNAKLLGEVRAAFRAGDTKAVSYVKALEKKGGKYMEMPLQTVTDKSHFAPSGDARDYVTLAPYWWPDSTKDDGLPYVRRDGKRNPEVYDYPDRERVNDFANAVATLGNLYYLTGNRDYASRCAAQLRSWFVNPATAMNPHLAYSQLVKGRNDLRGTGIIEARRIVQSLAVASMLDDYDGWTSNDKKALDKWAADFCTWLEESPQGRQEGNAPNNHGLWYEFIHITLLNYLGQEDKIRNVVDTRLTDMLEHQIEADGSLPEELKRTLSLHYCTFSLEALMSINFMTAPLGRDLWNMVTPGGKSVAKVIEWMYPYYLDQEAWTYEQIKPFDIRRAAILLFEAGSALENNKYLSTAKAIGLKKNSTDVNSLPYLVLKTK